MPEPYAEEAEVFLSHMCTCAQHKYLPTKPYISATEIYKYTNTARYQVVRLKLQVSFAEYGLFYRPLLQKRRIISRFHQPRLSRGDTLVHILQQDSQTPNTPDDTRKITGLFCRVWSLL